MKDSRWAGCTVTNDTLPAIVEPSPCFAFKEEIVKTVHCFSGSTKKNKKPHTHTQKPDCQTGQNVLTCLG